MDGKYIEFYSALMRKINTGTGNIIPKSEVLKDLCTFFGFAYGFVYQKDESGIFKKTDYYQVCKKENTEDSLNIISLLDKDLYEELASLSILLYHKKDKNETQLKSTLAKIFSVQAFVLVPIKNLRDELAGLVCLSDRRAENRLGEFELDNCLSCLSLLVNIIKLEIYEKGISNAEKILARILDHTGIDIYVNDFYTHEILYVNKSMAAPYGGVEKMMGKKCWATIFEGKTGQCDFCPQLKLIDNKGEPTKMYSWDYQRPFDGAWFRVLSSAFPWVDGRLAHLVSSVDITENKNNELLVQKLANCDALTGLANRRKLLKDIDSFMSADSSFGTEWCMLFCDLDGFKEINDTYGHAAGDFLLKEISVRLGRNSKLECKTYRNGGDEFVILLSTPKDNEDLFKAIDSFMKDFTDPCSFEGNKISCGCSVGVVRYPSDGKTSNSLLHFADVAMYEAKNAGKGTVRFYNKGSVCSKDELSN